MSNFLAGTLKYSPHILILLCSIGKVFAAYEASEDLHHAKWENEEAVIPPQVKSGSKMNSGRGCRRMCVEGGPPMTCRFRFNLEYYHTLGRACGTCPNNTAECFERECVTANGVERGILTVNRQLPGPSIQVCVGDTVVVDFENNAHGISTAIHWHGVLQSGSPYMDGVPQLTQCPILEGAIFRYIFSAADAGTYFWHSHSGVQKMDGVAGSLIIRGPRDPNLNRYDWDLAHHVVVLMDWINQYTTERFPGPRIFRRGQAAEAILINGRGRFRDPVTRRMNAIPLSRFRVAPGFRYRFRFIHAGCLVCPLQLSVESHRLTVISGDASPNEPVVVDSIIFLPGERYDVIITADQPVRNYWIHVKALGECLGRDVYQLAVLQYQPPDPQELSSSPDPGFRGFPDGIILNPLGGACNPGQNGICVSQLRDANPISLQFANNILNAQKVLRFSIPFDFHQFTFDELFRTGLGFKFFQPGVQADVQLSGRMDNISLATPPAPPLSQPEAWREMCANGSPRCCNNPSPLLTHRECFNVMRVPLNSVVEIVFLDNFNSNGILSHPMHVHGHGFYILEVGGRAQRQMGMHERHGNPFISSPMPPIRDTVAVPSGGFIRIRFLANNPGYWLVHCHVIIHSETGMAIVMQVGDQSDLPPVPKGFPKCGDFVPHI